MTTLFGDLLNPWGLKEVDVTSRGGVSWADAPLPRRLHRCTPWTRGWVRLGFVERCACGAIRFGRRGVWIGRNSRRRDASQVAS